MIPLHSCREGEPCPEFHGRRFVGKLWALLNEDSPRGEAFRAKMREPVPESAEQEQPKPLLTNLADSAAMLGRVVKAHAEWVGKGAPMATEEVQAERLAICRSNACGQYIAAEDRCGHSKCGCFLSGILFNKIRMATESCPAGHWQATA